MGPYRNMGLSVSGRHGVGGEVLPTATTTTQKGTPPPEEDKRGNNNCSMRRGEGSTSPPTPCLVGNRPIFRYRSPNSKIFKVVIFENKNSYR